MEHLFDDFSRFQKWKQKHGYVQDRAVMTEGYILESRLRGKLIRYLKKHGLRAVADQVGLTIYRVTEILTDYLPKMGLRTCRNALAYLDGTSEGYTYCFQYLDTEP